MKFLNKISIGMPVFNGEKYLREAIISILNQSYENFELIISDNASNDKTETICNEFVNIDGRVKYYRKKVNVGAADNYNFVFHESSGEYFKWAAHDDIIRADFLSRCAEVLDNDPDCVLAHPRTVLINSTGEATSCYLDNLHSLDPSPAARLARWILPKEGMCNPVFGLLRRNVMATTLLHGNYLSADRVFLAEMALRGTIREIDDALFLRRVHAEMSTRAHASHRELSEWFTGQHARGFRFKYWRLLREYARAVNNAPLSDKQKQECRKILVIWARTKRRFLARELCLPVYANGRYTTLSRAFKKLGKILTHPLRR